MTRLRPGVGRSIVPASLLAACALLLAACASIGGPTGSAVVPSSSPPSPSPAAPSDCGSGGPSDDLAADWGPYLIAGMTEEGTLHGFPLQPGVPDAAIGATIVLGRVMAFESGTHFGGDGVRDIVTPALVQVERVIHGSVGPGQLRFLIEGGRVGCETLRVDTTATVEIGRRYVLFLYPSQEADGTLHPETLRLGHDAWPVDAQDVVSTANGPMPLAELVDAIDRVTAMPIP